MSHFHLKTKKMHLNEKKVFTSANICSSMVVSNKK